MVKLRKRERMIELKTEKTRILGGGKTFTRRTITFFLALMILISSLGQVQAGSRLDIKAPAAILIDSESGQLLYGKNVDRQRAMASTSKLMTYLLVMDAVEEGKINLSDQVRVGKNAEYAGGSSYNLRENDLLTIDELLNSLMIISANDSAVVLAEHLAGGSWSFSQQMNAKARELGLTTAKFINPNGMPVSGNQNSISARDLAQLSRYIINRHGDHLLNITSKKHFNGVYKKHYQKNTNDLLATTPYVDGLKTGYTHRARFCLVSTARVKDSNNNRLIAVVMGNGSRAERARDTKQLLEYGLNNFTTQTILRRGEVLKHMALEGENYLPLEILAKENLSVLSKKDGSKLGWREFEFNKADLTTEIIEAGNLSGSLKLSSGLKLPVGLNVRKGISINVDGKDLIFDGAYPFIQEATTLVPVRMITEELGAKVEWVAEERAVLVEKEAINFKLIIDEKLATVNGEDVEMAIAPIIVEGNTMLPVRFLAEQLGLDVAWDNADRRVEILSPIEEVLD